MLCSAGRQRGVNRTNGRFVRIGVRTLIMVTATAIGNNLTILGLFSVAVSATTTLARLHSSAAIDRLSATARNGKAVPNPPLGLRPPRLGDRLLA